MKARVATITLALAVLASPLARASMSGGSKPEALPPPPPDQAGQESRTPRQEAEQLYADAYDQIAKAKKDLEAGKAKNAEKKFKRALDHGQRAVELDPRYHEAWNLVGYASRKLGDYDRALSAYEKCLGLKPDYAPAREYLGEALLERGDIRRAREQLAWLEQQVPDSAEARELRSAVAAWTSAHPGSASDSSQTAPTSSPDSLKSAPPARADTSATGSGR